MVAWGFVGTLGCWGLFGALGAKKSCIGRSLAPFYVWILARGCVLWLPGSYWVLGACSKLLGYYGLVACSRVGVHGGPGVHRVLELRFFGCVYQ